MLRPKHYFLLLISLIFLLSGCQRRTDMSGEVDAEHISYQVIYLERMAGDIPTKMLPDEMEAYYSKKFIKTSIEGYFGQFSLVQVANLKQNTVVSMLNFFGNKVYYVGKKGEIPAGIVALNNPTIKKTDDTIEICGFNSRRAIINNGDETYDIYYTEDIQIEDPNITTPYSSIDFVLADFRVQLSKLKMQLRMKTHESVTIPASTYSIPDDYKEVSKETMEAIINSLFTKE